MNRIILKRVYDERSQTDGYRILVDRLWPRGVRKVDLPYDDWPKEITPSPDLRQSFDHTADTMDAFTAGYLYELNHNDQTDGFIALLREKLKEGPVTFLYAAKDPHYNHAVILKQWAEKRLEDES